MQGDDVVGKWVLQLAYASQYIRKMSRSEVRIRVHSIFMTGSVAVFVTMLKPHDHCICPFPNESLDYCVSGIGPLTTRVDVAQSLSDQQKRYVRSGHKLPNPAAIVGCPAPKLGLFAKERRLLVLIGGGCDVVEPRLAKIRCCFNPHRQNAAGEMQGIGGLNL